MIETTVKPVTPCAGSHCEGTFDPVETYDYIFVGGGVSSLATSLQLARLQPGASIAIVDPSPRSNPEHRTFGYWFEGDSILPDRVGRTWDRWTVERANSTLVVELGDSPRRTGASA